MARPDFLVIGHVAKDLTNGGYRPGGTVVYSALTARNLGRRVGVVTSAGTDIDLARFLQGVDLVRIPSALTTTFRNVYTDEGRLQRVHAVADKIPIEKVPAIWRRAAIVHLGPIADEFQGDIIDLFPSSILGLTPQGWLRRWDDQGRVLPRCWSEAEERLARIDVLIVSEDDMAGEASPLRSQLGVPQISVVTQGAKGATLLCQGQEAHFAARKAKLVDSTGAGDVFAAAFLVRLSETGDPYEAMRFAGAAASLSVERAGISSAPSRGQIEAVVANSR